MCSEIYAGETVESELTVNGCRDGASRIDHLEHVQVLDPFLLFVVEQGSFVLE